MVSDYISKYNTNWIMEIIYSFLLICVGNTYREVNNNYLCSDNNKLKSQFILCKPTSKPRVKPKRN